MSKDEGAAPLSIPDNTTGRLFRGTHWATTPLGPLAGWPQSLRTAVGICLNSRFPMFVWWGPAHVNIYNDAYLPMLGKRHPSAFGQAARSIWADVWEQLESQIDAVLRDGQASWNERVRLTVERNGYPEPAYFTWSYSPVHVEDGSVGGLFCAVTEDTARVATERERDALLRQAQSMLGMLESLFRKAPGFAALMRGPALRFDLVNDAYQVLVGSRQLLGRSAFDALPELRGQEVEKIITTVQSTGVPIVSRALRVELLRETGTPPVEVFVDVVNQPVLDKDGAVAGVFVQGHDVTEHVRALRTLQVQSQRMNVFMATLAHEPRNLLAPIVQPAKIAQRAGHVSELQRQADDIITRHARQLSRLLDDLMDLSRIQHERLLLRPEVVDLRDVVATAHEVSVHGLEAPLMVGAVLGQGSEPRVHPPHGSLSAPAAAAAAPAQPGKADSRRILLADDNADALSTLAMLLEQVGFEVHTAADGQQACAAAERVRPEVAILDIGMPYMNGYEVASTIRALPWGGAVRLIALTGWDSVQDRTQSATAGFDAHCAKPVDIDALLLLIDAGP